MFSFFKNKKDTGNKATLPFSIDLHSHILPGVDDGAADIDAAIGLVKGIYALGIRHTIATPHIIGDVYRNNQESIYAALALLKNACVKEGIDIQISAAAEYMLDDYFLGLLRDNVPLLTISKNIILTEQSFGSPTDNLHEFAFEIITSGYRPIMAHPERYRFYHGDYHAYSILKNMGFLLQVNLLSLTGYYGKAEAKAAKYILANNLADFVGTDMHHIRHLQTLKDSKHEAIFNKYLKGKHFNNLDI